MAKTKSEDEQSKGGWHGLGFLRELMAASTKKTNQVNVAYSMENDDGSLGEASHRLLKALSIESKRPILWIARPKWYKELGQWKSKVPLRNDSARWFRIDVTKSCLAVVGNLIAGPKGKCDLKLTKTYRVALRSGDFSPKVLAKLQKTIAGGKGTIRTYKDIEYTVGLYLADIAISMKDKPGQMALTAAALAGLWAIVNHVTNDLRNTGDRARLVAIRNIIRDEVAKAKGLQGVPDALGAALEYLTKDKVTGPQIKALGGKVREHLDIFVVDIFFRTNAEIQNVFALEGRHRVRSSAERKILGGKVNTSLTRPDKESKLAALPSFNTKRKRKWLEGRRKYEHMIYHSSRQANTLPDDMRAGIVGFRIGGHGGQRSAPTVSADGSITLFLTPALALADAARRGETSTILWCARFSKYERSLHTGTISGIPKQGFTYIDLSGMLATTPYSMSQYLYQAAYDVATPEMKEKLSIISLTFTLSGPTPSYKTKLASLVDQCLTDDTPQPIRDYLRIAREGSKTDAVHAAFWPMSIVIDHVGSDEYNPKLKHLIAGSRLQDILTSCTTAKQRRWEMYAWIEDNFTASVYSYAVVTALKVMNQRGLEVKG